MKLYLVAVMGFHGGGVTAPCIIASRDFEAETEKNAQEAAEKYANEHFPEYAPFSAISKLM